MFVKFDANKGNFEYLKFELGLDQEQPIIPSMLFDQNNQLKGLAIET